jgi:hypothetical protein
VLRYAIAYGSSTAAARYEGIESLLRFHGTLEADLEPGEARRELLAGHPLYVLFMSNVPFEELVSTGVESHYFNIERDAGFAETMAFYDSVLSHPGRQVLFRHTDPDGMVYHVLRLAPAAHVEARHNTPTPG